MASACEIVCLNCVFISVGSFILHGMEFGDDNAVHVHNVEACDSNINDV